MSQKRLNKFLHQQMLRSLFVALAQKDSRLVGEILADLTTSKELEEIAKRLAIAIYLDKERSPDDIRANLGVSAKQINWVEQRRGNQGMQRAVLEIKAEQWAGHWSQRITKTVKGILGQ
jgi:uncharacterized protein YerC